MGVDLQTRHHSVPSPEVQISKVWNLAAGHIADADTLLTLVSIFVMNCTLWLVRFSWP